MRKAMSLVLVFLLSVSFWWIVYTAFYEVVGSDLNKIFLYNNFRAESSDKIVIVKIDNASLDEISKSDLKVLTFSKRNYLDLFDKLEKAGAKAIGLDVVFANPDQEEKFANERIVSYGNIVLASKVGIGDSERILPRTAYDRRSWGMIDLLFEKNVATKLRPQTDIDGKPIEAFSIALYRRYLGDANAMGEYEGDSYRISPVRTIPLDNDKNAYISFFKGPEKYPAISFVDVLNGKYDESFFRDKIVLVGEYWTLIHDAHFSPVSFGERMPGVEFHANMLDGLVTGKFLVPLDTFKSYAVAASVAIVTFLLVVRASLAINIAYLFLFPLLLIIFGRFAFVSEGVITDLFLIFLVSFVAPLLGAATYRYFVLDGKRRFITKAFAHYIAPEIVSQIGNSDDLTLGGEKRKITTFFSDIAGFTSITEKLGTEKLFALMEDYLSKMTDILVKNGGTLDKYIGDAIMGFYGAPLKIDRPEYRACQTALEQQLELKLLSKIWVTQGLPLVQARIGINTGEAMVGNIGSKNRFNYTAIGDSVNLASRLEGVNKFYGTYICVSETTYEAVKNDFVFRRLDRIKVKWKTEGVTIYELIGYRNDIQIDIVTIAAYEAALEKYFSGDLSEAKKLFDAIADDPPSKAMSERVGDMLNGHGKLENGVYALTEK